MWPNDIIRMVRSLIDDDDLDTGYTYSDVRLKTLITVAALDVVMSEDFSYDYRVDISDDSISPDPAGKGQNGRFFQLLTAFKAAIMVAESDYRTSATKAVSLKDGPSAIDMRASAEEKRHLFNAARERYENARVAYHVGDGSVGEAILGPYNIGMGGGSSTNLDSFGDGNRRRFS